MLRFEERFLLAVHSSFRTRKEHRWGLAGGGIERGEKAQDAVQRELKEELELYLSEFIELGAYSYKGHDHMIFGADVDYLVTQYDEHELVDLRWFDIHELQALDAQRKLHAGYELQAVRQFIALADH